MEKEITKLKTKNVGSKDVEKSKLVKKKDKTIKVSSLFSSP